MPNTKRSPITNVGDSRLSRRSRQEIPGEGAAVGEMNDSREAAHDWSALHQIGGFAGIACTRAHCNRFEAGC